MLQSWKRLNDIKKCLETSRLQKKIWIFLGKNKNRYAILGRTIVLLCKLLIRYNLLKRNFSSINFSNCATDRFYVNNLKVIARIFSQVKFCLLPESLVKLPAIPFHVKLPAPYLQLINLYLYLYIYIYIYYRWNKPTVAKVGAALKAQYTWRRSL